MRNIIFWILLLFYSNLLISEEIVDVWGDESEVSIFLDKVGKGEIVIKTINVNKKHVGFYKDYDLFAEYGMNTTNTEVKNLEEDRVCIIITARFEEIFSLIKFMDSSHPFTLGNRSNFQVLWKDGILELLHDFKETDQTSNIYFKRLSVFTEGKFISASKGSLISIDKKSLVFSEPELLKSIYFKVRL